MGITMGMTHDVKSSTTGAATKVFQRMTFLRLRDLQRKMPVVL
jgi:hypothetical protein